jgi:hypothetical protein
MPDDVEVLLWYIREEWTHARLTEEQRATITNFIIVITVAVLGFLLSHGLDRSAVPITTLLAVLGVYGAIISQKYYERWGHHVARIEAMRNRIDEIRPNLKSAQLLEMADVEHRNKSRILSKVRLNWLWLVLHISIALIGIGATILAIR